MIYLLRRIKLWRYTVATGDSKYLMVFFLQNLSLLILSSSLSLLGILFDEKKMSYDKIENYTRMCTYILECLLLVFLHFQIYRWVRDCFVQFSQLVFWIILPIAHFTSTHKHTHTFSHTRWQNKRYTAREKTYSNLEQYSERTEWLNERKKKPQSIREGEIEIFLEIVSELCILEYSC